jgi:hypothetical protein
VTELEILKRRRELVLLSAELQRATLVRRLDHVQRHPINTLVGLATSVVSVPILIKVGMLVAKRVKSSKPTRRMNTKEKRFSVLALLPLLRYVPAIKAALPKLRSFNFNRQNT